MKVKFTKYLCSIGIAEAFFERIESIYRFCSEVCADEIIDIFVTDYITEDGTRNYENLWFFTPKYWMEAKLFATEDNFDMTSAKNKITHWGVKKQDYDFKRATEKSRFHLTVDFEVAFALSGELKASKENCDHLKKIFLKYVVPNLR